MQCDNAYPVCSNCAKANLECSKPPESEASRLSSTYTKALEDHVARLESKLAFKEQQEQQAQQAQQAQQTQQFQQQRTPVQAVESPGSRSHNVADIVGLLSLGNAEAPSYIGSSSGYSLATNLSEMVQATVWNKALWVPSAHGEEAEGHQCRREGKTTFGGAPKRRITISELRTSSAEPPSDALGTRLIETYLGRIHPRFPILVRSDLWEFHRKRHLLGAREPITKDDGFSLFVLYMVYAIGALNLRLTETYTDTSPENFYISALKHVSSAREASSIHNVEAMVLLILYHLRSESHYGLWHMTGLAMRTGTDLGLHRQASTRHLSPFVAQLRRRLFWTLFSLEGVLASTLGRPMSLSDRDIDQPLPLSVDDDDPSGGMLEKLPVPGQEAYPYTNMTQSILLFQLRRFESRVQRSIYRVDRPTASLLPKLYPLYRDMEAWHANIPQEVKGGELDRPLLNYHKTMRMLTQPFLGLLNAEDPYFQQCVTSAGQICQIHKRLHQTPEYGHSFIAVHTVFVAGITLLYCLWLGREKVWSFGVSNNLRACSYVLSIMGERAPWVRRYRDVYEGLVEATMAALEKNNEDAVRAEDQAWSGCLGFSLDGLEVLDDGAWNMARELAGWIDA